MSEGEEAVLDTTGKFVEVVVDGDKRNDVEWRPGRIVLSNRRLVLVGEDGKRTIPLSKVASVTARTDGPAALAGGSGYLSIQAGADVTLVAPQDVDRLERALYDAILDGRSVYVKHPAVAGGVVKDAEWEPGRVSADGDRLDVAVASGTFLEITVGDVADVQRTEATVDGADRHVVDVGHAVDGTSVRTHVAGGPSTVGPVESFLERGAAANEVDVDLDDVEREVLMALYSGVSPFEIPDFVGIDVERAEAVFEGLVERDVLEPVRTRREVQLEARGRSIASDELGDG